MNGNIGLLLNLIYVGIFVVIGFLLLLENAFFNKGVVLKTRAEIKEELDKKYLAEHQEFARELDRRDREEKKRRLEEYEQSEKLQQRNG